MIERVDKISLGESARAYAQATLAGQSGMSGLLLDRISSIGQFYSVLPGNTNKERAESFKQGGGVSTGQIGNWLFSHIAELHNSWPDGLALFHDLWARKSDFEACKVPGRVFCGDDVYLYFPKELNSLEFSLTYREIVSFQKVGVFTPQTRKPTEQYIDGEYVAAIARNAIEVYIGAYDQEGVVVWCA
jgi:hypothetical protein